MKNSKRKGRPAPTETTAKQKLHFNFITESQKYQTEDFK